MYKVTPEVAEIEQNASKVWKKRAKLMHDAIFFPSLKLQQSPVFITPPTTTTTTDESAGR